jgi:predicted amidohydrolase
MRVHLVQLDIAWEDRPTNHQRVRSLLDAASIQPGDLVVLPEMFDTGFSMNSSLVADRQGLSQSFLQALAREHGCWVVGGFATIDAATSQPRNRAIAVDPSGTLLAAYDKQRLFPLGVPCEAQAYTPGTALGLFDWTSPTTSPAPTAATTSTSAASLRVAMFICYDLRFPELFRAALALGAEAFVVIANWPASRVGHWEALLIARAIENQAWVIAVNRAGNDPPLTYPGCSLVIDPKGTITFRAGAAQQVGTADLSREALDTWRGAFPAWKAAR